MVTKNFRNMIYADLCSQNAILINSNNSSLTGGTSDATKLLNESNLETTKTGNIYKICVSLGTGTTKENDTDYKLESEISLTCNAFTLTKKLSSDTAFNNVEIRYVASFTNNTSNDVTVSEIGMYYTPTSNVYALIYRKTFEPITIAVGETKTFSIVLS